MFNKLNISSAKSRFLLIGITSFVILVLILSPLSNPIKSIVQQDSLIAQNKEYLRSIVKTDRVVLMHLAEIDSLLGVLQSGEVGISFIVDVHVTVGNSLKTFSKVVNSSLEATIFSIMASTALEMLLDLCESLSWLILILLLIVICLHSVIYLTGFNTGKSEVLQITFIEILALLFISTYLIVPYSIHGASYIENMVFLETTVERNNKLENLHKTLSEGSKNVGFKDKAKNDFKKFERVSLDLTKKIENVMAYHVEHFLHTLFRAFLIPIGIFSVLAYLLKMVLLPKLKELVSDLLLKESTSISSELSVNPVSLPAEKHVNLTPSVSARARERRNARKNYK